MRADTIQRSANTPFMQQLLNRCPNFFKHELPEETIKYRPRPKRPGTPEPTPEDIKAQQAAARREQIESRQKRFIEHGCGPRYKDATLENYRPVTKSQELALDAIKAQSTGVCAFSENIVLHGPVGSGKDHLLIGLAKLAIDAGHDAKWIFGVELFRKLRESMGGNSFDSESRVIESLTGPDVLILSDPAPPGGEASDYQRTTLLEILDHRYRHCKPTWATINVTDREDAESRIGMQAIDRLWGESIQIFVNGPSGRTKTNQ